MRAAHGLLIAGFAFLVGLGGCPLWNSPPPPNTGPAWEVSIALPLEKSSNRTGETPTGDLFADAYLAEAPAGTQVALFNSGSLRCQAPTFPQTADDEGCPGISVGPGLLTQAELTDIVPFEATDHLVVVELTAAQLESTLERSVSVLPQEKPWFMQVAGLSFHVDCAGAAQSVNPNYPQTLAVVSEGSRVSQVQVGGRSIDVTDTRTTYRVVTNSFEAQGSDGHVEMGLACQAQGCQPFDPAATDFDGIVAYLNATAPVGPPAGGRITLDADCVSP